jgi:hypothetical protein
MEPALEKAWLALAQLLETTDLKNVHEAMLLLVLCNEQKP